MPSSAIDPILNDFVYSLLYGASYEEKRGLKGKYIRAAMSGDTAKRFCTSSSREEKEYLRSHFGVQFFYVVAKKGVTVKRMEEIFANFKAGKKAAAMREMAEAGIYVCSDKEFTQMLGVMAQSIHHHSFFLNLEFLRQGYHIQKWKRHSTSGKDMEVREAQESAKVLAATMLNACVTIDYVDGLIGITPTAMKILLHLYSLSHTYVEDNVLYSRFAGAFNKTKYRYAIKALIKGDMIIQQGPKIRREITITTAGIQRVNNFLDSAMRI
jgi:hypothetical protein